MVNLVVNLVVKMVVEMGNGYNGGPQWRSKMRGLYGGFSKIIRVI